MFMLLRIEIYPGLLRGGGFGCYSHPTAAIRSQGGLDEYHGRLSDQQRMEIDIREAIADGNVYRA